MNLFWNQCKGDAWCKLATVNLEHEHFDGMEGVYVIWHGWLGDDEPATVYVGQGEIRNRLLKHRKDPEVQEYRHHTLFATWAEVDRGSRDGVERYLADRLNPKVGDHHPDVAPIEVNLPWDVPDHRHSGLSVHADTPAIVAASAGVFIPSE